MKKILLILTITAALFSCKNKKQPDPPGSEGDNVRTICTLGMDTLQYREDSTTAAASRRPPKKDTVPIINPDNPTALPVIYLDFDGDTVKNTSWNYQNEIICAPASLDSTGVRLVTENVIEDFSPWHVTVTTSEAVFNATPVNKRQKIILTASAPFGLSGGQSILNSFGTGNPSFVFTALLITIKKSKEATSHELGHCFGLYHQSDCSNGVVINQYRAGVIMGNGYYVDKPAWVSGTNAQCRNQNDLAQIDRWLKRK